MKPLIGCLLTTLCLTGAPKPEKIRSAVWEALAQAQRRRVGLQANGLRFTRQQARKQHLFPRLAPADTLFLLEMLPDTGGPVIAAYAWTSQRDSVIDFREVMDATGQRSSFASSRQAYANFHNFLRSYTERMDTAAVARGEQALDSDLVFISQVQSHRYLATYFFRDITPLGTEGR